MLRTIYPDFAGGREGLARLFIRVIVGAAFMFHGYPKLIDIGGFAQKAGVPVVLGAAAAFSEFFGGAMLALGLLMPLANVLICTTMAVAFFKVHWGQPFVAGGKANWELAGVYFWVNAGLLLLGPGLYSLDALIFRRRIRAA